MVEDDAMVRELMRKVLERAGFDVMLAPNGEDGLAIAAAHDGPIRLVIADIIMPRMSGRELVDRLRLARPDIRALYMSGYSPATIAKHGLADPAVPLIEKPFTAEAVIQAVKRLLAAPDRAT